MTCCHVNGVALGNFKCPKLIHIACFKLALRQAPTATGSSLLCHCEGRRPLVFFVIATGSEELAGSLLLCDGQRSNDSWKRRSSDFISHRSEVAVLCNDKGVDCPSRCLLQCHSQVNKIYILRYSNNNLHYSIIVKMIIILLSLIITMIDMLSCQRRSVREL